MESITLNNNQFKFELLLISGEGDEGYELPYSRIGQLVLSTSVEDSLAIIDFTYVENAESTIMGRTSPNGRTMVTLSFGTDGDDEMKWTAGFVLDYVKLSESSGSTQSYRVRGIAFDCQTLTSRVPYFTESEDPLKTLSLMTSAAGMEVDFSSCPRSSGVSLPFMSGAGDTLLESVESLLNRASSSGSVFFMAFSLSGGAYRVCNVGASMKDDDVVSVRNVPSSEAFFKDNVGSFTEARFRDGPSLVLDYPSYSDVVNHEFSFRRRGWSASVIGGFVSETNALVRNGSVFSPFMKEQDRQKDMGLYFGEEASNDAAGIVGRMNRYVASSFDLMDLSAMGAFDLESGRVVIMPESDGLSQRLGGLWMVRSASQWFTKESWTTKVTVSRLLGVKR